MLFAPLLVVAAVNTAPPLHTVAPPVRDAHATAFSDAAERPSAPTGRPDSFVFVMPPAHADAAMPGEEVTFRPGSWVASEVQNALARPSTTRLAAR